MAAVAAPLLTVFSEPKSHLNNKKKKKNHPGFAIFHFPQRNQLCASSSSGSSRSTQNTRICEVQTRVLESKIQELCQKGNLEEAMKSISLLSYEDFSNLNVETYCFVLQLCSDLRSLRHGKQLHSLISSSGIEIDSDLGSKLVSMFVNCGELREGRRIFDGLTAKENPFPWNLLMSKYAKIGEFMESIVLFRQMWENGTDPNSRTFSSVLKCFTALGNLRHGMAVHGYLQKLDLFNNGDAVGNALISLYSKCLRINIAIQVFDKMPVKDIISWNSIIHGCVSRGLSNKAVELFSEMLFSGMDIDLATLVSVLPALAEIGALAQGRTLHGYSIKAGFVKEVTLNNSLLDMYFKCFAVENAVQVFEKMSETTIVSWTSMVSGYTVNALYEEAIALFEGMEAEGLEPDLHFITSALHACACSGSLNQGALET